MHILSLPSLDCVSPFVPVDSEFDTTSSPRDIGWSSNSSSKIPTSHQPGPHAAPILRDVDDFDEPVDER